MFEEGADIVDIGGESTRPGKRKPVGIREEIDRVLPVLEGILRHRPQAILSIDTYKSQTAAAALAAGAEIVNDVSGFLWDEAMAQVCAAASCGVVLMHTRGRPEEWHALPALDPKQVVPQVRHALQQRLEQALEVGNRAGADCARPRIRLRHHPSTRITPCLRVWKNWAPWDSRCLRVSPAKDFWAEPCPAL